MKDDRRNTTAAAPLLEDADKLLACIHCGFCLSSCPTFTREGNEGDSPRGRLDLMRAVVEGRLEPDDPGFTRHIDRCVGCRACETACPAGVQYGVLLERARATIANAEGHRPATRLLLGTWGNRVPARVAGVLGRLFLATGIAPRLARALPERWSLPRFGLAMLASARAWKGLRRVPKAVGVVGGVPGGAGSPPSTKDAAAAGAKPWQNGPTRRVALLTGCVQEGLYGRVNAATRRVLEANGIAVVDVPDQRCCGALHAHAGDLEAARERARANVAAFEAAGVDAVVVNAAGCGAIMKEYGELLAHDPAWAARAEALAGRTRDLFELLVEAGVRPGAPLALRVAYDAPCHLYHAQRVTHAPLEALGAVPGLEAVAVPDFEECCGGAGIYGLEHPDLGGRILRDKLEAIRSVEPDVVVTPNPGCMMQIGAGLLLHGDDIPVLHPVEILDESYRRAGAYGG